MSPNVRYFAGVAAVAGSMLLVGCGGGGGGGDSGTTARATTATVTLANHMPAEEEIDARHSQRARTLVSAGGRCGCETS